MKAIVQTVSVPEEKAIPFSALDRGVFVTEAICADATPYFKVNAEQALSLTTGIMYKASSFPGLYRALKLNEQVVLTR